MVALIFRAVAIEFRSKQPMRWWRQMWDAGFASGSLLSSFFIGVTVGNTISIYWIFRVKVKLDGMSY